MPLILLPRRRARPRLHHLARFAVHMPMVEGVNAGTQFGFPRESGHRFD
jgi:hypothetical protein